MHAYREQQFREKTDKIMIKVKQILDADKNPKYLKDTPHEYTDKFTLVQALSSSTIDALVSVLRRLGMGDDQIASVAAWTNSKRVTLRFSHATDVKFLRKETNEVDSKTKVKSTSFLGSHITKLTTTVESYFWEYNVKHALVVFPGSDPVDGIEIVNRQGVGEVVTATDDAPKHVVPATSTAEADVTDLFKWIQASELASKFQIDRNAASCKTPRRNDQVTDLLRATKQLQRVVKAAQKLITKLDKLATTPASVDGSGDKGDSKKNKIVRLEDVDKELSGDTSFVPVVPFMLDDPISGCEILASTTSTTWSALSAEHTRYLDSSIAKVNKIFASRGVASKGGKQLVPTWITTSECILKLLCDQIVEIVDMYGASVDNVEAVIHAQLVDAIGSEIQPKELAEYMQFHNRKLFKRGNCPTAMLHDVRRAGFTPEGSIAIESMESGSPITTACRVSPPTGSLMSFPLTASTDVQFQGKKYLHGYMAHMFSTHTANRLRLVARARQFSNFVVMIGTVVAADRFEPKHAVILQNKDELAVMLNCSALPTAKEFRDAIESLSENQKAFAKAYRKMQLASTLFGICVVPVKPLMEKLLNLPPGGLAKEIQLTQDLMKLFIEFQVPSDLLTFTGPEQASLEERLEKVKEYRSNLLQMVDSAKDEELREKRREDKYAGAMSSDEMSDAEEEAPAARGSIVRSSARGKKKKVATKSMGGARRMMRMAAAPPLGLSMNCSAPMSDDFLSSNPKFSNESAQSEGKQKPEPAGDGTPAGTGEGAVADDYTIVPDALDRRFDEFNNAAKVRPTTIKPDENGWTLKSNKGRLLGAPVLRTLTPENQTEEKNKAMDLLDALSRSGEIVLDECELHVVVAMTHCFDETVMDTLVKENENPIDALECSTLLLSSVVMDTPVDDLVDASALPRLGDAHPELLDNPPKKKRVKDGEEGK